MPPSEQEGGHRYADCGPPKEKDQIGEADNAFTEGPEVSLGGEGTEHICEPFPGSGQPKRQGHRGADHGRTTYALGLAPNREGSKGARTAKAQRPDKPAGPGCCACEYKGRAPKDTKNEANRLIVGQQGGDEADPYEECAQ